MTLSSLISSFGQILLYLTDATVPLRCPLCHKHIPFDGSGRQFCSECLKEMPFVTKPFCKVCGGVLSGIFDICADCLGEPGRQWRHAYPVFQYEKKVQEAVRLFKYGNRVELSCAFGRLAAGVIPDESHYDCITYIPLHWRRYIERGYNQAAEFAFFVARRRKIPMKTLLRRVRDTKHQAFLKKDERSVNVEGAFAAHNEKYIRGRKILLADDVMTTGATLAEGAKVLLEAGAAQVDIVTIARRQRG